MANEAGIDFDLFDVAAIMRDTPYFVDLRPGGKYVAKDLYEVGGVPVVMKELAKAGLLHLDCMTAIGQDRWAKAWTKSRGEADGRVIYPIATPLTKTGGVVGLKGNLAPDGAIVKVAGMTEEEQVFTGPARVFECEEEAFEAVKSARLQGRRSDRHPQRRPRRRAGHARDAVDHGGPVGAGHGQEGGADHRWPVLWRDARLLRRPCRARGGAWRADCAAAERRHDHAERGDGRIVGGLSDEELARRKAEWKGPRKTDYTTGALWKFAKLVGRRALWCRDPSRGQGGTPCLHGSVSSLCSFVLSGCVVAGSARRAARQARPCLAAR